MNVGDHLTLTLTDGQRLDAVVHRTAEAETTGTRRMVLDIGTIRWTATTCTLWRGSRPRGRDLTVDAVASMAAANTAEVEPDEKTVRLLLAHADNRRLVGEVADLRTALGRIDTAVQRAKAGDLRMGELIALVDMAIVAAGIGPE